MLTAKTKSGKMISLSKDWSHDLVMQLKKETFFCPVCGSSVLMKLGNNRRWHFAHQSDANCGQTEPESDYHLEGKQSLYEWIKKQNYPVQLEPFFPALKQRPDLFVSSPHKIPIEFQCATIAEHRFLQRTNGYVKAALNPVWILGGNRLNRIGAEQFRVRQMDWLALRESESPSLSPYFIYFCPLTDRFAFLSNIIPYSKTQFFANITFMKRELARWETIMSIASTTSPATSYKNWEEIKTRWRSTSHKFRLPASSYMNKMLVSKGASLPLFPSEAGIPSRFLYWIETPAYLWQTWILLSCLFPLSVGKSFHFQYVYQSFQKMVTKKIFSIRVLPFVKKSNYAYAILDYLLNLADAGVLRRSGKSTFVKIKPLSLPRSLEEAVEKDKEMQTFFREVKM